MAWAMLVLVFCKVDLDQNGFHIGPVVHALLINIYLAKFFYWETGYFNTLDITMDRAGYYLCWGCLCWVQVSKPRDVSINWPTVNKLDRKLLFLP